MERMSAPMPPPILPKKIGLVLTGASGACLALEALRLLDQLARKTDVETHVIITDGGRKTASLELTLQQINEIETLPTHIHDDRDLSASFASGSNPLHGLIFIPCSIRSLSAIAYSQTDRLSIRAADVMLKERRPLVLAVRETPFHMGHLRAMQHVTEMGGFIAPPVPAFYLKPRSIDDMVRQSAARLLSLLGLDMSAHMKSWEPESQTCD